MIDIHRAIQRKILPGKQGHHDLSMLVVTNENISALMQRLRDAILAPGPADAIYAQAIGRDAIGHEPAFDPFSHNVRSAWIAADQRNEFQNLSQGRPRDRRVTNRVDQFHRRAALEVDFRLPGEGKAIK